ncbi:MAG: CarD family transcriptional regulator [Eubacterium sp.]|nr:CarD family transcriptional regulator [Eubacterium sp.]
MYEIGDKIVYPMHGAGIVEAIEEKEIFDVTQLYYLLHIVSENMEILIPVDKSEEVGIREVVSEKTIDEMLELLGEPGDVMNANWNKRYQDNMDILKSGDLFDAAYVVKNLTIRDRERGLSGGEKKLLTTARNFVVSEMVLVRQIDKAEALRVIDACIPEIIKEAQSAEV